MINLIKKYTLLCLSFIILIISFIFMFEKIYIQPLEEYENTINTLSNKYRQDELNINKKFQKLLENNEEAPINIDIMPKFLQKINNTCKAPEVIIRKLIPNKDNPFRFELQFISSYFDFMKILSEFEKLNITIHNITIKPYEIDQNNPKHFIVLDIQAIQEAQELSPKISEYLEKEINKENKRNPFQRFAKLGENIERVIDLTWIYKLSSIGKISGKNIATIDRRQYYEDDTFEGMKIIKIESDKIILNKLTNNGNTKYIITFRLVSKNNKDKDKIENE